MNQIAFNIAKKQEIRPFDGVEKVEIKEYFYNRGVITLRRKINKNIDPSVIKIEKRVDTIALIYPISVLDFNTVVEFTNEHFDEGRFLVKTECETQWVNFTINDDTLRIS